MVGKRLSCKEMEGKRRHIEMSSAWWLQANSKAMETVSFMFFGTGRKGSTTVMRAE